MDRSFLGIGGRRSSHKARNSDGSAEETADVLNYSQDFAPTAQSDHLEARIWLRLLHCARSIENTLSAKLRKEFNTSLARFELLSHLERFPAGLRMSDLSKHLMVSNGTSTGIVAGLVDEGLVERAFDEGDRRTVTITMTEAGREAFRAMAKRHEEWVIAKLGELSREAKRGLLENLVLLDRHVSQD
jgi:DNA-binding MarR family transcriptional regulator